MVPGEQGCRPGMTNLNGNPIDCEETDQTIRINQKEFPKRQIGTPMGIIFIIDDIIFDNAPYMDRLLPRQPPIYVPRIFITLRLVPAHLFNDKNQSSPCCCFYLNRHFDLIVTIEYISIIVIEQEQQQMT